ncbi:MAG: hypothetical protein NZ842_11600 [Dehalococcoidia bacterium]|nr:hypothetical protein [Dehalococcoidia bacterium]
MTRKLSALKKLLWLTLFGVGFAMVEAAVVIYLRQLLHVEGSNITLSGIPRGIFTVEIVREFTTLVMLISVGVLAGSRPMGRFGSFIIAFGVWDIFYYVFLSMFHGWPRSFLDWDLLFLIPVPWMAPVLAPVLVSCGLIFSGYWLLIREQQKKRIVVSLSDWIIEAVATVLILYSFTNNNSVSTPEVFSWIIFLAGLVLGVGYFVWRMMKSSVK